MTTKVDLHISIFCGEIMHKLKKCSSITMNFRNFIGHGCTRPSERDENGDRFNYKHRLQRTIKRNHYVILPNISSLGICSILKFNKVFFEVSVHYSCEVLFPSLTSRYFILIILQNMTKSPRRISCPSYFSFLS